MVEVCSGAAGAEACGAECGAEERAVSGEGPAWPRGRCSWNACWERERRVHLIKERIVCWGRGGDMAS